MLKTTLSTDQDARNSLEDLPLDLWYTLLSLKMPLLREILHNRTIQCSGRPSMPINMEAVWNHLISKKHSQKKHFDKLHNTKSLSELNPSQEVLFLSPVDHSSYIPGAIIDKALIPQSYTIEAQDKKCCRTREHFCPIQ